MIAANSDKGKCAGLRFFPAAAATQPNPTDPDRLHYLREVAVCVEKRVKVQQDRQQEDEEEDQPMTLPGRAHDASFSGNSHFQPIDLARSIQGPVILNLRKMRRLESLLSWSLISTSIVSNQDPGEEAFQPPHLPAIEFSLTPLRNEC
jgi:hypothetical protein